MSGSSAAPLRWFALAMAVLVADQASKWVARTLLDHGEPVAVRPGLDLTLVYNTGMAFSLLADASGWQRWLLVGLAGVVAVAVTAVLWRLPGDRRLLGGALALVLGGALGNLVDRVVDGRVTDFIDLYVGPWHWPAFNLADSAITVGAVLLVIDALRHPG